MIEVKLIGDWEIKREHVVKAGSLVEVTHDIAAQLVNRWNSHDALVSALERIIERSHNDPLGASKVIDMRKISEAALALAKGEAE